MKRSEVINKVVEIISTQDDISEAEELARQNDITLAEVWENDEIIGMMVEDDTIYF